MPIVKPDSKLRLVSQPPVLALAKELLDTAEELRRRHPGRGRRVERVAWLALARGRADALRRLSLRARELEVGGGLRWEGFVARAAGYGDRDGVAGRDWLHLYRV
mgnify:CR=1 FL=1